MNVDTHNSPPNSFQSVNLTAEVQGNSFFYSIIILLQCINFHSFQIITTFANITDENINITLSDDLETVQMNDGIAVVEGAICTPHPGVNLTFTATSVKDNASLSSVSVGPINVTNELHLASFYFNYDSGLGFSSGAFSDSFAQYAVEDINAGIYGDVGKNIALI